MTAPNQGVRQAIDRGIGQVTRRIEIYESDAVTLWGDSSSGELVGGGVNLTYGDNERRVMDISLNNVSGRYRSNPNGFWYDKVVKLYRGVSYHGSAIESTAAVIEHSGGTAGGVKFAAFLKRFGIKATYVTGFTSAADLMNYDIIFSFTGTATTVQQVILKNLYNAGKNVVTISVANTASHVPHLASITSVTDDFGISQPVAGTELSAGWTSEGVAGSVAGTVATAVTAGAVIVARWLMNTASYAVTASAAFNGTGGKWFDLHLPSLVGADNGNQINILLGNVLAWMRGSKGFINWETQIGEFVIDGIGGAVYPSAVKVTGRDYVKKCLNSKIENAVTFASGTRLDTLITAVAANAGISKLRLASMSETLSTSLSFDRGTPRWEIIRQAAHSANYEIYFDHEGWLVTRKFLDPTLSPISHVFKSGASGNLSTLDRSTNDSRIYNHIVVYGDPASGEQRMPYIAEAKNNNLSSPTRISKIGDRYYSYASTFFTSQLQCQDYADRLLKLHALESFELNFTAINYPWIEVGEIGQVIDPNAVPTDPDRYLLDTASIPLSLGPMSSTGKRVTVVG